MIAAASGGRERSPIAMGGGIPMSGMACFLVSLPQKQELVGTNGARPQGSIYTEFDVRVGPAYRP